MKLLHFSILPRGILFVTPWLFKIKPFKELTFIILYPFVFVFSARMKDFDNRDIAGNHMMIMIRQAEELFIVSTLVAIGLWFSIHWFSLLAFMIYPSIYLWYLYPFYKKIRRTHTLIKTSSAFLIAWWFTETPLFTEAYTNCNSPGYLRNKRNIFAWLRYTK